jgi:anti-anti-sigma regulatory factor
MEKLSFRTSADNSGLIETIEIEGVLALETALELKNELVIILNRLHPEVKISIGEVDEMDLTAVQLLVAFIRNMDQKKIKYQIEWNLDEDQKAFFINVGIGDELYMNN